MLKISSVLGGGAVVATLLLAHQASAQPGGSYMESCRRIEQRGPILSALCRDVDGNYRSSSIDVGDCRGGIANTNGRLTCNGGGGRRRFDDRDDRDRGRDPRVPGPYGRPPY